MKFKRVVLAIFLLIFTFAVGGAQSPEKRLQVVVYNLEAHSVPPGLAEILTSSIVDELSQSDKLFVRDEKTTIAVIKEKGMAQSGFCGTETCRIDNAKIIKADRIILGSVGKLEEKVYVITLRVADVNGTTIYPLKELCRDCSNEQLLGVVEGMAKNIRTFLETGKKPEAPVAPPPAPAMPTPAAPQPAGPRPEEIKFIAATPEQQKLCPPDMVYVPAGWFMMGCNAAKDSRCQPEENPYHPIYLDAFCIDKYEYPNQVGVKPRAIVNWQDAQGSCSSLGKRLPMEAQWEKAARGTDGRVYPWGDSLDAEKQKALKKKYNSGTYSWNVSPYGVFDMAGNVWEWVADWYDENYYKSSPNRNPTGPASGLFRVLRGGSWYYDPDYLRSSYRGTYYPGGRSYDFGFRCARTR